MRGEQPVVGLRVWPRELKRSWSSYISELKARRAVRKRDQIEVIERLGRERRRARRAGEFVHGANTGRRWC